MKRLLNITLFSTFILFLWGATVRSTGSGLGCPDWPLCHGQIIPTFDVPTFLEWGHRMLATIVGVLTLSILIVSMRAHYRKTLGTISLLSFFLLLIQAGLGGAAILTSLAPYVVSIHLGVGTLFLTTLLWMRLRLPIDRNTPLPPLILRGGTFFLFVITLFVVYAQLILGGFVASSHAGLVCPDFPKCFGEWIPPLQGAVALHFWHRIMAYLIFVMVSITVFTTLRKHPNKRAELLLFHLFGIMILQVLLGISNVLFALPTSVRVAHLGMGIILYGLLFITAYEVKRARVFQSHETAH